MNCPRCNNDDVEYYSTDGEGDIIFERVKCLDDNCNFHWVEFYKYFMWSPEETSDEFKPDQNLPKELGGLL